MRPLQRLCSMSPSEAQNKAGCSDTALQKTMQSLLHHSTGYQICIQPCAEINKNSSNCQRSQVWMMCAYHKALIALEHCRLKEMSMPLLHEAYRQLCTKSLFSTGDTSRNHSYSNPHLKRCRQLQRRWRPAQT